MAPLLSAAGVAGLATSLTAFVGTTAGVCMWGCACVWVVERVYVVVHVWVACVGCMCMCWVDGVVGVHG